MIRAFLLLCLITRDNFAFTVRGILHTSTLPSVEYSKTVKVSISTSTPAKVTTSVTTRSYARNCTTARPRHRKMKGAKEAISRRGAVKKGKTTIIRSFIPFTEGNFAEQLSHTNALTRNTLNKGNLKMAKDFKATTKDSTKTKPRKLNLEDFNMKFSTIPPFLSVPYKSDFPRVYETIEEVSKVDRINGRDYADVIPLLKQVHDDASNQYTHLVARHARDHDNPIFGDQPFFSFILNDYFDRNVDEDPMIYKDLHWGQEFDVALNPKRIRRLGGEYEQYSAEADSSQPVNYDAKYAKEKLHKKMNDWKINERNRYSENATFNNVHEMFAQKFGSSDEDSKHLSILPKEDKKQLLSSSEILDELAAIYDDRRVTNKDILISSASELKDYPDNYGTSPPSSFPIASLYSSKDLSRLRYLAKRDALFNNADYIDTSEFVI